MKVVAKEVLIITMALVHVISLIATLFYFLVVWTTGNDDAIIKMFISAIVSLVTRPAVYYVNTKVEENKLKEENEKVTGLIK